ncbi:S-layer homology domain-containing protein [Paenibacillus sp. FSL R7-0652]|uniref:S-layer homology domain-containing protein n=1 Tax=Paenibacillus sp. FSL R7-0652 TaxID=2921687 RepID=UPI00315A7EAA
MGKIRKSFSLLVVSLMLLQGVLGAAVPAGATPVEGSDTTSTTSTNPPVDTDSSDSSSDTSTSNNNQISDTDSNTDQNSSGGGSDTEGTNNNENTGSTGNTDTNTNPENNEGTGSNNSSSSPDNNNSSNVEVNLLDPLNLAKSNQDAAAGLAAIQDPNLGLNLPADFNMWTNDEKEAVAEFVTLINGTKDYVSKEQVQYILDMAVEPRFLFSSDNLEDVEEKISIYFGKLTNLPILFGADADESIQEYYSIGKRYTDLSAVDKKIFTYKVTFNAKRQGLASYKNREQLSSELSPYYVVNDTSSFITMQNVLVNLRLLQKEFALYNSDPNTSDPMPGFSLNLDKMDAIDYFKKRELAQWMIDKRPQTGYGDYQAIQKAFDRFFNPITDPLEQLNEARASGTEAEILEIIKRPDWIYLPEGFTSLQPKEQLVVARAVMKFISYGDKYDTNAQVQYAVEVGYKGLMAFLQTDADLFSRHLDDLYTHLSKVSQYTSSPNFMNFQGLGKKYLSFSKVDKELLSNIAKRFTHDEDIFMKDSYGFFLMLLMQYSPINSSDGTEGMTSALLKLYTFQQLIEQEVVSTEKFPLDFSKMSSFANDEVKMGQLAQHMLGKKPVEGYQSIEQIQKAFNSYFSPVITPTDPNSSTGGGSGNGGNSGSSSGSVGGGSSASAPVTTAPTTKQEQLVVDVNGVNGSNLTKTPITRTTETSGKVKDLVKMTEAIAKQSVEKAKQLGTDTARIVIPDTKDAVSETRVEVPKTAVKDLSDGSLKLEISTENAVISIPTKSIAGFDQDLYFRIVPLKKESERKEVEERAKQEQVIQQAAPNANVRVLARPVEIETNMQSREVTLTLPLGSSLPTETAARQQALNNLAVYIEHSDGTKELVRGKLVKLTNSSEGIEFTVTKFSTFTLVVVDGLNKESRANHPYIQGFGTDFRPDAFVTRAQMAAMLARNLSGKTAAVEGTNFADVAAAHWAAGEIQQAQAAGIMNGLNDNVFAPEGSITRAQMATIAYRWMQQQQTNETSAAGTASAASGAASFTDVAADLWAADAIAYVQSAGLMTGYNDGTFKPDGKLTRAEAVKVLNVLFKRTPLTAAVPSFSDVPAEHWAYADIEAAAQK